MKELFLSPNFLLTFLILVVITAIDYKKHNFFNSKGNPFKIAKEWLTLPTLRVLCITSLSIAFIALIYNNVIILKNIQRQTILESKNLNDFRLLNIFSGSRDFSLKNYLNTSVLLAFLIHSVTVYSLSFRTINFNYDRRSKIASWFFFTFKNFLVFAIFIIIQIAMYLPLRFVDDYFINLNYFFLDWLEHHQHHHSLQFEKGLYFALFISTAISFIISYKFFTSSGIAKTHFMSFVRYLTVIIIIFLGMLTSIYSLTNLTYNFINFDSFQEWYNIEKGSNLILLRLSSLILFFQLSRFIFNYLFNKELVLTGIYPKVLTYRWNIREFGQLSDSEYSSMFFSQVGFFILILCVLLYSIVNNYSSISHQILNWGIFFILDDWGIIHRYSDKFKAILNPHRIRILVMNSLMFLLSIIILFTIEEWLFLVVFMIVSAILFEFRYSNYSKIEIREQGKWF